MADTRQQTSEEIGPGAYLGLSTKQIKPSTAPFNKRVGREIDVQTKPIAPGKNLSSFRPRNVLSDTCWI